MYGELLLLLDEEELDGTYGELLLDEEELLELMTPVF